MTTDDEALLKRELYWSPRPGDRRRPAGSNAITAIGIVLTLVMWAVSGLILASLMSGPPGSGVIDPRALVALAVFGAEMFLAGILATRIWVGIGPQARSVLRPFAILGPWPMLIIAVFAVAYVVALVVAPFMRTTAVTSGRNWQVIATTAPQGATYDEAVQLCEQTGARVPRLDDIKAFDPPFPRGTAVWLEQDDTQEGMLYLGAEGIQTRRITRSGELIHHRVVCFRE